MGAVATRKLFIGGSWGEGDPYGALTVVNPATEEPIGEVLDASAADAEAAVQAAAQAFDDGAGAWPSTSPRERSRVLLRLVELLEKRRDELVDLIVREVGSSRILAEMGQVDGAVDCFRYWAEQAATFPYVEPLPPVRGPFGTLGQGAVVKEPIGVVAAITPFNFPLLLAAWKVGPALAMGNTVVLKPSPYTPLSSLVLAEAVAEADLPAGAFNVVTGGTDVGEVLTTHEDVAMVTFTGSDMIGRQVMAQASGSLKRVVLELGGKSANVVFGDVDLDDPSLMTSLLAFTSNTGQGCVLTTRLLVESSVHDELVGRLEAGLGALKVGDPADPTVAMGPLIREVQRQRVETYIEVGTEEGARLAFGGGRPAGLERGFFVDPTLFVGVENRMRIAQEEIFGPVGVVIPFEGPDEAVTIANDSRYGLGGSVWSGDRRKAYDVASAIRAGYVTVNGGDGTVMGPIGPAPFGGYKHSGVGREHGRVGAEEFLEFKTLAYPAG